MELELELELEQELEREREQERELEQMIYVIPGARDGGAEVAVVRVGASIGAVPVK